MQAGRPGRDRDWTAGPAAPVRIFPVVSLMIRLYFYFCFGINEITCEQNYRIDFSTIVLIVFLGSQKITSLRFIVILI